MSNLNVGFGRADITPEYPVPLRGHGNSTRRLSIRVLDRIYVTCIAFTGEDGETALIYSTDLTAPGTICNVRYRPAVSRATGIPYSHIVVAGTHTHAAPDTNCDIVMGMAAYLDRVEAAMIDAAQQALADRTAAEVYTAAVETEKMNFVRRYVLQDGSFAGSNYGDFKRAPIARHETQADGRLQLIKIRRAGRKDILLSDFQVHQTWTGKMNDQDVSADMAGAMREEMERRLGCLFAYFTGGAGNTVPTSRIKEENVVFSHVEHGRAMADYAMQAEGHYTRVSAGEVKVRQLVKGFDVDHRADHLVETARALWEEYLATGDRAVVTPKCRAAGMNSVYRAEAILTNAALPATQEMELNVISVGDVAFCAAPAELFDSTCRRVMDASPFRTTFMLTCCHDAKEYIPAMIGFVNGGYSADTCRFVPGTAEEMEALYHAMLTDLHG